MAETTILSERVKGIRREILTDICLEVQATKNRKVKFTETQAPRLYFDGGWRDIIEIKEGFFGGVDGLQFGWHDSRCAGHGVNAYVGSAQLSTELLLQCHALVYGDVD